MMDKQLLELVSKLIPEDAGPLAIVLFILCLLSICALFRANTIYKFVEKFDNRELLVLKNLLSDEYISEKAKKTLQNKIDSIAYKKVTGIKTDINMQEKIVSHYKLAEGRLKYLDFKRAFAFLVIDKNGDLKIRKPNIIERILYGFWLLASGCVCIFLSLLLVAFVYATVSIRVRLFLCLLIIYLLVMLVLFLLQVSSIHIANKIRNEIRSHHYRSKNKQLSLFREELNRKLDNLSNEQLNSVHQLVESLEYEQQPKQDELPVTNEDIDRIVETYRKQNKLLPIGLAKGEFTVPDDFNDPLPDEILDLFDPK